jgi:hypothetical protein
MGVAACDFQHRPLSRYATPLGGVRQRSCPASNRSWQWTPNIEANDPFATRQLMMEK